MIHETFADVFIVQKDDKKYSPHTHSKDMATVPLVLKPVRARASISEWVALAITRLYARWWFRSFLHQVIQIPPHLTPISPTWKGVPILEEENLNICLNSWLAVLFNLSSCNQVTLWLSCGSLFSPESRFRLVFASPIPRRHPFAVYVYKIR